MTTLRDTYGHFSHRPLAERIADLGGLRMNEAGISDAHDRIDPTELVRQRATRDFAASLLQSMGWTLELKPPEAAEQPRQAQAESDGAPNGEG